VTAGVVRIGEISNDTLRWLRCEDHLTRNEHERGDEWD
jgi:hypothetical protein